MTYVDGFVIACPKANKQQFIAHAQQGDGVFMDLGATRIVECWGDDVPDGKQTDFRRAVKAGSDEAVLFSWIEWPDKATRDAAMAHMQAMMTDPAKVDPRMDPDKNPMPFDGKRMIYGGFANLFGAGLPKPDAYVEGFVTPVPADNHAAYRDMAEKAAPIFRDLGATRVVENWEDDVKDGATTDFRRAVNAKPDEKIVFSWIEYPDKKARNAANERMRDDPRLAALGDMPWDGKRMIFGGFTPVVALEK